MKGWKRESHEELELVKSNVSLSINQNENEKNEKRKNANSMPIMSVGKVLSPLSSVVAAMSPSKGAKSAKKMVL